MRLGILRESEQGSCRALKARLTQKDRPVDVVIIEGVG